MFHCPQCWDTPCKCGHEYTHLSTEDLKDLIIKLQGIIDDREK